MQDAFATTAPAMPVLCRIAQLAAARSAADDAQRLTLDDGRSLLIRPVEPRDAAAEQAFVANLSPSARFRRFHFGLNELPETMLRAFVSADQHSHVALVAEAVGDERRIVADARYVLDGEPGTAEFAIAVSDAWQGFGLGRKLMLRLLAHARSSGIKWLCADVLADNAPMLALMRRLEARLAPNPEDGSLYRVCIAL
jgi:acetyltransferase